MKYIYKQNELKQRSEEWNLLRETKIGASIVPTILGQNKYEKPITLWKRKTGKLKPKEMNAAMRRGIELEDKAIEATLEEIRFQGIPTLNVEPIVAIHPKHTDIAVSFDGVDLENNFIVEVKCPTFSRNFVDVFNNGIPQHYYAQVQLQLFVANEHWGIKKAYFGSYFPDGAYVTDFIAFKDYLKYIAVVPEDYNEKYCEAMIEVIDIFVKAVKDNVWDEEEYQKVTDNFAKRIDDLN